MGENAETAMVGRGMDGTVQTLEPPDRGNELAEIEARYHAVLQLACDLAYEFRVEPDGRLLREWGTDSLSRLTGFSAEELAARGGWAGVIHPEDWPEAQRHMQALLSGRQHAYELRVLTKDGAIRWMRDSGRPVWDQDHGRVVRIYGAAWDITDRKRAEERAEQAAATAERERLARDLHDAVTQTLFSVAAIAEALPRVWQRDPAEGRRGLEDLRLLTQGALAEMRTLLLELRPAALMESRLGALLNQLGDAMVGRTQMPVTTTVVGDCCLPAEAHIGLYRIAQEALSNIAKHAKATRATVGLWCESGGATLRISDDGCGFEQTGVASHQMGLKIMRERAQGLGAALEIVSAPGQGTEITVHWPVDGGGRDSPHGGHDHG